MTCLSSHFEISTSGFSLSCILCLCTLSFCLQFCSECSEIITAKTHWFENWILQKIVALTTSSQSMHLARLWLSCSLFFCLSSVIILCFGDRWPCKQLCVIGFVAWFLLEWLCNSNPFTHCLCPHVSAHPTPRLVFYMTLYEKQHLLQVSCPLSGCTGVQYAYARMIFNLSYHSSGEPVRKMKMGKTALL